MAPRNPSPGSSSIRGSIPPRASNSLFYVPTILPNVSNVRRLSLFELLLRRISLQRLHHFTTSKHPSPCHSGTFAATLSWSAGSHAPQIWNGRFFKDTALTALGLVIQVGHQVGDNCPSPSGLRDLMVFDLSGAHRLVVRYCDCINAPARHIQLLRGRWFPATIDRPSTAFAFDILDFFHKLQDQNKCNPYDFYHAIIQRTDAAGLNREIVRYSPPPTVHLFILFYSSGITRFYLSFASGLTSSDSNGVELCTALVPLTRCPLVVWQFCVQPAPTQGRIRLTSLCLSCMRNLYLVLLLYSPSLLLL